MHKIGDLINKPKYTAYGFLIQKKWTELKYVYMRSIEARFNKLQQSRPGASTLANFNNAITGRNFSHKTIHYWFNILVDKEDYRWVPKNELFAYLLSI